MTTAEEVLSFWFGSLTDPTQWDKAKEQLWFQSTQEWDQEIERNFKDDVHQAARGEYAAWGSAPKGCLALIILLDQFPRNVFRGSSEVYAYDSLAQTCCLEGISLGLDQKLFPIERQFFYLPLMHSEEISHHKLSLSYYRKLKEEAGPRSAAYFSNVLEYAEGHYNIVKSYGRFPHRNAILNRRSTQEEQAYLSKQTHSYGQSAK